MRRIYMLISNQGCVKDYIVTNQHFSGKCDRGIHLFLLAEEGVQVLKARTVKSGVFQLSLGLTVT